MQAPFQAPCYLIGVFQFVPACPNVSMKVGVRLGFMVLFQAWSHDFIPRLYISAPSLLSRGITPPEPDVNK